MRVARSHGREISSHRTGVNSHLIRLKYQRELGRSNTSRYGWAPGLSPGRVAFVKLNRIRDDCALSSRVVEEPRLVLRGVADEDALLSVRGKPTALVLLYMHVHSAAEHTEVRDVGLPAVPRSERCTALESRRRRAVVHMHQSSNSMAPERRRQACLVQDW